MKKFINILFVLTIISFFSRICINVRANEQNASTNHIPRVVSIVFDDSGSMRGFGSNDPDAKYRWAYAGYALQAFVAMMGEDDVLYVTYINDTNRSGKVVLTSSEKRKTIATLNKDLKVNGGTANRLQEGVNNLVYEYGKYKNGAKYYFVVMADGDLDSGSFSEELPKAITYAKESLVDKNTGISVDDFETFFFLIGKTMDDMPNVKKVPVKSSEEIITELKNISAKIMGRTDITEHCTVNDSTLTFELKYPAHNISLLVQKANTVFENVDVTAISGNSEFPGDTYSLSCPVVSYNHEVPESKPYGFVSLITNNGNPLPKGFYSIDLSAYAIDKSNITVLVEPAVKVGCKFYVGDNEEAKDFTYIKSNLREGDSFAMECVLYEVVGENQLGDIIPSNVLNPIYEVSIGGQKDGISKMTDSSLYTVTMKEEYANKDFKVEAVLTGYQPFVFKDSFNEINKKPVIAASDNSVNKKNIILTKPLLSKWNMEECGIEFEFTDAYDEMIEDIKFTIDGFDGFDVETNVKIEGKKVVYIPKTEKDFSTFPDKFSVSVIDVASNEVLATRNVEVIKPEYKIVVDNQIDQSYGIASLSKNAKSVTYTLVADYEGKGEFIPVSSSGCEKNFSIEFDPGELPGKLLEESDKIIFTPGYDVKNDKIKQESFVGKIHELYAVANISGKEYKSDTIYVEISKVSYKINVESSLPETLNLESLKNNSEKITFSVVADYEGDGTYRNLIEADTAIYDTLVIDTGIISGEIAKDGRSFTPKYDPNSNSGVSVSDILGKEHSIKATVVANGNTISSDEVKFTISSPAYRVVVKNSQIGEAFYLDTLKNNSKKIIFTVEADYIGDGKFGPLATWDSDIVNNIEIAHGELPGRIEEVYESSVLVGMSFTPLYDENDNKGIPYTAVSGIDSKKVHTITATIKSSVESSVEVEVSVWAPKHTISVRKDGIEIVDVELTKNKNGVEFEIHRDNRILSKTELDALNYNIYSNKNKKSISLKTSVLETSDGKGYLKVTPEYKGNTFISTDLWEWANLFRVSKGEMQIVLELGDQKACAVVNVATNPVVLIIFWVVLGIILFLIYFAFCCITRIRFAKGTLYRASFSLNTKGWILTELDIIKKRAYVLPHHLLLPFKSLRKNVRVLENSAKLVAPKAFGIERTYPHWVVEPKKGRDGGASSEFIFNFGSLSTKNVEKIINFDSKDPFAEAAISGKKIKFAAEDGISVSLSDGEFISEVTTKHISIIFFKEKTNFDK